MNRIRIAGKEIGEGAPVFIVAEVGTTCNGDVGTALALVDAARDGGADAIKFMVLGPDHFMSDRSATYDYEWAGGHRSENMYEMFKSLMFTEEEWFKIRDYCREKEFLFYATVDYLGGVDFGEALQLPAYKLSSWDITNLPLIIRLARTGKPIQIDLGPADLGEIEKALNLIRAEGNDQIILVHCSHAQEDGGINLRSIPHLQLIFDLPVGYSADTRDSVPDIEAVALGSNLIEKRLTLDRSHQAHHHIKALEPCELKEYITMIRRAEAMLGTYAVKPSVEDLRQRSLYFVSIAAETAIPSGTVITREMLGCRRPGTGISPHFLGIIVGRKAKREIKLHSLLSWDDI